VRRARLVGAQAELWPDWRHFAFITNRTDQVEIVEAEHRNHAVVEQVIADLKTRRSRTSPPATTPPTAPGPCWPHSRTTSCAGPKLLGLPDSTVRAARTCAAGCSASPAD
jgi:hypothetical protein